MIILYAVLVGLCPFSDQAAFDDVSRSIEIFNVMKKFKIAQRCAELTQETLEIARRRSRKRNNFEPALHTTDDPNFSASSAEDSLRFDIMTTSEDIGLFANLMNYSFDEINLMSNLR